MKCPYCNFNNCYELYDINCVPNSEHEQTNSYKTYYCEKCKKISKIKIEEVADEFATNLKIEKLDREIGYVKYNINDRENAILSGNLTEEQLFKVKRDLEYQKIKLMKLEKQKDYILNPEKYDVFDIFFSDEDHIFDI